MDWDADLAALCRRLDQALKERGTQDPLRSSLLIAAAATFSAAIFAFLFLYPWHPEQVYILTGTSGGQFYKVGNFIQQELRSEGYDSVEVVNTQGSVDNCHQVARMGRNAVALVMAHRKCDDNPELKGVAALYPDLLHVLVRGYDLSLMSVDAADGLLDDGRNLVIVALVGIDLHIRIFDANGKESLIRQRTS